MQLRKNLNLYLSGIVVFTLTLLLLSTAFVLDESLGNRVAKIFWFYKVIIVAGIACIPLAWTWTQSRWQMLSGTRASGARLRIRCPAGTDCGGKMSAAPSGSGPAAGTDAEHWPLDTRHTHSPSPERVRGADSCRSCTEAGKAMVFQSKSNI